MSSVMSYENRGKPWIKVRFRHGDYNEVHEDASGKTLVLAATDFLQAISESLPLWGSFALPPAFRPLGDILQDVRFVAGEHRDRCVASVPIALGAEHVIVHAYDGGSCALPAAHFFREAVERLAENPVLPLENFDWTYKKRFLELWNGLIRSSPGFDPRFADGHDPESASA